MRFSKKLLLLAAASGKQLPPDFLIHVGSTTGVRNSSGTYTAPLPEHEPGDLLVVFLQKISITTAPTVTNGWTYQGGLQWTAEGNSCRVYTKIAESSSEVFIPSSGSYQGSVALAFRSQTGRVPKFEFLYSAQVSVASSSTSSFPAVTPSAGLQKYTWLPCCAASREETSAQVPSLPMPSGYTRVQTANFGSSGIFFGRTAVGIKSTHATSETPGTMAGIGWPTKRVKITAAVWEE